MRVTLFAAVALLGAMTLSCQEDKLTTENQLLQSNGTIFKSVEGSVILRDGILDFENTDVLIAFKKKITEDTSFQQSVRDQTGNNLLVSQLDKQTISGQKKEILENLAPAYPFILNNDAAYVVGKEYVRFGQRNQYAIEEAKKNEINWGDEENIDNKKVSVFKYGKFTKVLSSDSPNARADFGPWQDLVGGGQREFYQVSPTSGDRKWIDEIYSRQAYLGTARNPNNPSDPNWYDRHDISVTFLIRLFSKSGRRWNNTTIARELTPHFSWQLKFGPNPSTAPVFGSGTVGPPCCVSVVPVTIYTSGDYFLPMADLTYVDVYGTHNSSLWYLEGSGTIKHRITGDVAANDWTRSWTW
ncbi:hypothetical protein DSL64_05340 [Dyadobacter luteus]|uniref:Uncharacterized protein n=1 Tax=Dyadobacter luteus TaxID=2259619 RepID=A0A3D8YFJ7_9BACT|nr:hypothetical protein [Dyadobacter luteus]REA63047.1 hypothetical protein DSL64_05340 [Dyadobacter luteus]